MEHVIVVLNVAKEYEKADEVDNILFSMLLEYGDVEAEVYRNRFRKYFELAGEIDREHMKGYSL